MFCLSPITVPNPAFKRGRVWDYQYLTVPCGKCPACIGNKRNEWTFRMQKESSLYLYNIFFTLTYDEINEPWEYVEESDCYLPYVDKSGVQNFIKRLRFNLFGSEKGSIRYAISSEYGPHTLRPHYHGIIFNFPQEFNPHSEILRAWNLGHVQCGLLNDGGAAYCSKYIFSRQPEVSGLRKNFFLCSRRPALGSGSLTKNLKDFINSNGLLYYPDKGGVKTPLPRIFKSKIFSDEDLSKVSRTYTDEMEIQAEDHFNKLVAQLGSESEAFKRIANERREIWTKLNRSINHIKNSSVL